MRPLLRPPPAATPTAHPTDPTQPIAHDRPLDPGSAVRQSVPPAGHSALFCPSGVVLLSVVFVDLPWEATPPHFYSVTGTRPAGVLEVPHQLLLFSVYGNDRLAALQKRSRLVIEVGHLHRSFRGRSTFFIFPIGLQTVAQLAQQAANRVRRHPVSPPGQAHRQVGRRLARPPPHV